LLHPSNNHAVTLPDGVETGQTIHVQAPGGRLNAIVIPPGFGPGSTFTVEFAPEEAAPPTPKSHYNTPSAPAVAVSNSVGANDGFAAGFNNPNYVPPAATAVASSYNQEPDVDLYSYPTTSATPVYPSAPQYPSK
jgi:hypothetical protein